MTSPEQINSQNFPISRARGYDRAAVRGFLSKLADEYQALVDRIDELEGHIEDLPSESESAAESTNAGPDVFDRLGNEISAVLQDAREAATEIRRRVYTEMRQEVSGVLRSSKEASDRMRRAAQEEAEGIVNSSKERANQLIRQAERRADEVVKAAEKRRSELVDDAMRRHKELVAAERDLRERADKAQNALKTLHSALAKDGDTRASRAGARSG
jgi:DivIVA domain-containing protein